MGYSRLLWSDRLWEKGFQPLKQIVAVLDQARKSEQQYRNFGIDQTLNQAMKADGKDTSLIQRIEREDRPAGR
jgi:hypothetical protein